MVQELRALLLFQKMKIKKKKLGLIPNFHMAAHTICNSNPRGSTPSSGIKGYCKYDVSHRSSKTLMHKKLKQI